MSHSFTHSLTHSLTHTRTHARTHTGYYILTKYMLSCKARSALPTGRGGAEGGPKASLHAPARARARARVCVCVCVCKTRGKSKPMCNWTIIELVSVSTERFIIVPGMFNDFPRKTRSTSFHSLLRPKTRSIIVLFHVGFRLSTRYVLQIFLFITF